MAGPSDRYPPSRPVVASTFLTAAVALGLACDGAPTRPTVAAGLPAETRLAFIVQPSQVDRGRQLKPAVQVAVQDALGRRVSVSSIPVTIALGANPTGATLIGTTTVHTAEGIATFSTLRIDRVGPTYTLVATAAPHGVATSDAFAIGPPSP